MSRPDESIQGRATRTCPKGHRYDKSTDCPTCPVCERAIPMRGDLPKLTAPARRALQQKGISTLWQLAQHKESEISGLHGIGTTALHLLQDALTKQGLTYKG